ncbi:hypothetical protein F4777DRAFT_549448 [Nemania sp. FL0916]|nr:hypothetical protein F4777DRAFT_549448 [Nemania sp. FL0916]
MARDNYHAPPSGPPHPLPPPPPPPPPPSYDHYASRPLSLPPPPPPSQRWDRRDDRDGRDGYRQRNLRDRERSPRPRDYHAIVPTRGSYSELRDAPRDFSGSRDDYRPPRGDFTFRQEAPAGISSYNSYRPSDTRYDSRGHDQPPRGPRNHADRDNRGRGSRHDGRRTRGGRPFDDRRRPPFQRREREKAADRLLLSTRFDEQSEMMLGDKAVRATYRDVDELSDSDEIDMDISDNGDSDARSNSAARPAKRARTDAALAPASKWSNPDPYTALPPPETTRKKDVVQLIRKARVEAEAKRPAVPTEAADFISCDFSDDDTASQVHGQVHGQVAGGGVEASSGPYSALKLPALLTNSKPHPQSLTLPPKPPVSVPPLVPQQTTTALPLPPPSSAGHQPGRTFVDLTPSNSLGNRKRTIDDEIVLPVKPPHTQLKKVNRMASGGTIDYFWKPAPGEDPCPWQVKDHSAVLNMGTRLHHEITDFYNYVRPRDFEERMRQGLIKTLEALICKKWRDARLFPFGSFMSGLYLPTADMDIAICSRSFVDGGEPLYDKKRFLWQMKSYLEWNRVPYKGEVEAITKAKVPLLKYADDHTGLKVDISFEKMDGYKAIDTFRKWKEQYPAMPPLVALIKHFLLMRRLNEPVSGGIGGFTVICMVVHLLQMMPQVQSGSMKDEHLGELLMEFLDYYGHRFEYETVAIRMDPPGTINKAKASTVVYRNLDRLSIIDPNNPENDISGGSSEFWRVKTCFAQAYDNLQKGMMRLAQDPPAGSSDWKVNTLLYPLIAGNYSQFQDMRKWLQKLDSEGIQPDIGPAPPRPIKW